MFQFWKQPMEDYLKIFFEKFVEISRKYSVKESLQNILKLFLISDISGRNIKRNFEGIAEEILEDWIKKNHWESFWKNSKRNSWRHQGKSFCRNSCWKVKGIHGYFLENLWNRFSIFTKVIPGRCQMIISGEIS